MASARPAMPMAIASAAIPLIRPLAPHPSPDVELDHSLGDGHLTRVLAAYMRSQWRSSARTQRDGHAGPPSWPATTPNEGSARLQYLQIDRSGHHYRIYHYVGTHGRDFLVDTRGRAWRVFDPLPPMPHARISSGWGWRIQPVLGGMEFHHGIDYAAPVGTPVRASLAGVVDMVEWHGRYGRMIEIRNADGLVTRYGHLHAYAPGIRAGSHVSRGQLIGYVGSTGLSTGPHLYYEVWKHGRRIDPLAHSVILVATRLNPRAQRRLDDFFGRTGLAP
jgi:murein DD-endopeptidase MepM/ murein hydrolase activator NlpD